MGRPLTPQKGYRKMAQDDIFQLTHKDCIQGIKSCRTEKSIAKKYGNLGRVKAMELQIGAFDIQMDMIASGDIHR